MVIIGREPVDLCVELNVVVSFYMVQMMLWMKYAFWGHFLKAVNWLERSKGVKVVRIRLIQKRLHSRPCHI